MQSLLPLLTQAYEQLCASDLAKVARDTEHPSVTLGPEDLLASMEKPRQADHGDLSITLAMRLAKPWGNNPRAIAQSLLQALQALQEGQQLIETLDIAGPGFINLRLKAGVKTAVVAEVLALGSRYGCRHDHRADHKPDTVLLEFVSANPTGPLHVGHGRQAALGDVLAEILNSQGKQVTREFYYNDAGNQIEMLTRSVRLRLEGITPEHPDFPEDGYRGAYIQDIADAYLARKPVTASDLGEVTPSGDPGDLDGIRQYAVAYLRHEQDLDLKAFGVQFDHYALESALYREGHVERVVQRLVDSGDAYEQDGALWLRTTDYGDDKDRVMRKSEGGYTYFVPDLAYHEQKFKRGHQQAINIQGSDHHGTIARVRAGLQALRVGIPQGYPSYILHKMVTVMRDGQEVKISKRAGAYVTLRDLLEWSGGKPIDADASTAAAETDLIRGRDAVRFFLVSRKADSEFVFDIDLALARSDENPVFYVQYAHARISAVLRAAGQTADEIQEAMRSHAHPEACLALLTEPQASALCARLQAYPALLAQAADDLAPHLLPYYLRDLSGDFHSFYNAARALVEDPELRLARLALMVATQQVLKNGLALLGVTAPDQMDRTERMST